MHCCTRWLHRRASCSVSRPPHARACLAAARTTHGPCLAHARTCRADYARGKVGPELHELQAADFYVGAGAACCCMLLMCCCLPALAATAGSSRAAGHALQLNRAATTHMLLLLSAGTSLHPTAESAVEPISSLKTPGAPLCELCQCAPCQCSMMRHTGGGGNNPYEVRAGLLSRGSTRAQLHSRALCAVRECWCAVRQCMHVALPRPGNVCHHTCRQSGNARLVLWLAHAHQRAPPPPGCSAAAVATWVHLYRRRCC